MNRKIAIIGLGYVGLPLAVAFLNRGFKVTGIDLDEHKLHSLTQGRSYIADVPDISIAPYVASGAFMVTKDFAELEEAEAVIICVPTPLTEEDHVPDLTYLVSAAKEVRGHLKPGQLVTLESSTYPGTTKEVLMPILEESGLTTGQNLFIGFSPERVDPGNKDYSLEQIPKVISGVTAACLARTEELYSKVFQVVKVSSTDTAEMTKLLENTFRFVNISFINEFAVLCDKMGINVWEVVEAARSKPFGFTAFYPGPGIGGHCIPVDPLYLLWKTKQMGTSSSFIELSYKINLSMPNYVISRMKETLNLTTLAGARIMVLGVTFKENVADIRESSAIDLIQLLLKEGAEVTYYDPYFPEITVNGSTLKSVDPDSAQLQSADCVLIATHHKQLPLQDVMNSASFVFDTRNATQGLTGQAKVITLGGGMSTHS